MTMNKNQKLESILESVELDKVLNSSMKDVVKYLVDELCLFSTERDLKLFILEYVDKAYREDNCDWPIRYYEEDEPIAEPSEAEEMLTDKYIQTHLKGSPVPFNMTEK